MKNKIALLLFVIMIGYTISLEIEPFERQPIGSVCEEYSIIGEWACN